MSVAIPGPSCRCGPSLAPAPPGENAGRPASGFSLARTPADRR
ncbi:hypothetical protein [Lysobacter gummosus]